MVKWVLVLSLFYCSTAFAQFGLTTPVPVQDSLLEAYGLKGLANQATALQLLTATTQSLTVPGGAGLFQSAAGYLQALNANLSNSQQFAGNFPGAPRPDVQFTLGAYAKALNVVSQQAAGMSSEDSHLADIEARSAAITSMLQGQQVIVEAVLALCQQVMLDRQLQLTDITVRVLQAGQELNERSLQQAQLTTKDFNHGGQ